MKITFLGTGTSQGVPVIACKCKVCQSNSMNDKRLRTSIMIEEDGQTIVIDSGPDFRQQMLRENVQDIDAIIFTHEHKDHIAGLDDIRAFNFFNNKIIDIYAEERVHNALKKEFSYVFEEDKYPGVPEICVHEISNQKFKVGSLEFLPIRLQHYFLPIFGYRIKDFTYITDANYISNTEIEKIKGSKVVVLNALRRKKHISHFTLDEALELFNILKPEKAYITHLSHQMGLHKNIENELPTNIFPAYDGLIVEL
ncbi:MAG: MBL fold metallo-hydrolase [Bacteroidetes bacterium]|nr:MBL fold metallo-hydrolase [Bacteroidota bacterium]MBT6686980.1 MBL fold metallo-hydrolase [Bacteroidota bacterium]MBT7142418.1 MBL fold metallo-hydrolase [Bacteroidota bacterium]MBT7490599.1 MBL fold metallo-hydrolase [Bacteroidota bacterium]